MSGFALVTAPVAEPVSVIEAKAHLRVTDGAEDALISALITAARQSIEGRFGSLQRALMTQTWDWFLDGFPCGSAPMEVPLPPLQSVTSITYTDDAGAAQTWDASKYSVNTKSLIGLIAPAYGESYPSTRTIMNAVTVRFVAGFGAGSDVPMPIKQAMLLQIGHMYENRETHILGVSVEVLPTVKNLLSPYGITSF